MRQNKQSMMDDNHSQFQLAVNNHIHLSEKAHGEVFCDVRPAATMVEVSRLVNSDHLVEIEVDAVVEEGSE